MGNVRQFNPFRAPAFRQRRSTSESSIVRNCETLSPSVLSGIMANSETPLRRSA
jgi:hypothetical protein